MGAALTLDVEDDRGSVQAIPWKEHLSDGVLRSHRVKCLGSHRSCLDPSFAGPHTVRVSTVRTYAGGAADNRCPAAPFSSKDYADETPWPYETMVFVECDANGKDHGDRGFYHRPYANRRAAINGHAQIVEHAHMGWLEMGAGVCGYHGIPALQATDWHLRREVKRLRAALRAAKADIRAWKGRRKPK